MKALTLTLTLLMTNASAQNTGSENNSPVEKSPMRLSQCTRELSATPEAKPSRYLCLATPIRIDSRRDPEYIFISRPFEKTVDISTSKERDPEVVVKYVPVTHSESSTNRGTGDIITTYSGYRVEVELVKSQNGLKPTIHSREYQLVVTTTRDRRADGAEKKDFAKLYVDGKIVVGSEAPASIGVSFSEENAQAAKTRLDSLATHQIE